MGLFGADSIEGMIQATADAFVRFDGVTTWAHVDHETRREFDDATVLVKELTLVVATGKLPGLAEGQTIEVDESDEALDTEAITAAAVTYEIRFVEEEQVDGGETRIGLKST